MLRPGTLLTGLCNVLLCLGPSVCLSVCVHACVRDDKADGFGRKPGGVYVCRRPGRCSPKLPLNGPGNALYILQPGIPSSRRERARESHCVPSWSPPPLPSLTAPQGGKPTSRARKLMSVSFCRSTCGRKHRRTMSETDTSGSTAPTLSRCRVTFQPTFQPENAQPTLRFLQEVC